MKLIKFDHHYDFGHDWYVQLFNFDKHYPKLLKNISLFKFALGWSECSSMPYLQIICGQSKLFSFVFSIYKIDIIVELVSHTWNFDIYKGENLYGNV